LAFTKSGQEPGCCGELCEANLAKAVYEPDSEKLPVLWTLTDPGNYLEKLVFHRSPAALMALRDAFKKGGMRSQERQLIYAIEYTKRLRAQSSPQHPGSSALLVNAS
jgi:hypothetical protein